jgi:hypothetical protein
VPARSLGASIVQVWSNLSNSAPKALLACWLQYEAL